MTSNGKIRVYELSRDLGLENKEVLDAAHKLSIAAKSHSSSISNEEANQIREALNKGSKVTSKTKAKPQNEKVILSVKKAEVNTPPKDSLTRKPIQTKAATASTPRKPTTPQKPKIPSQKPPEKSILKTNSGSRPSTN